jgi:putative ABC transport system substrate-binding protein
VEGQNLSLDAVSANNSPARLVEAIEGLVSRRPHVIISQGTAIFAVRKVEEIPVVFAFSGDPLSANLSDSLARPSRNMTGVSFMSIELNAKRLELLRELLPNAKRIVLIGDPVHPGVDLEIAASQAKAQDIGLEVLWYPTRDTADVKAVLANLPTIKPDALVVLPDGVMLENRDDIAQVTTRLRIPAISGWSMFAHSGGLFTYGPRLSESFKRLGYYTARILRGAKPTDLPIERPAVFELVVNLKAARALGLTVPTQLLVAADEVIE